jgi:hypothetical protein
MSTVISGKCAGRRDASDKGITVPTLFSRSSKRFYANEPGFYAWFQECTPDGSAKRASSFHTKFGGKLVCQAFEVIAASRAA